MTPAEGAAPGPAAPLRSRTVTWADPRPLGAAARGTAGLAFLQAIVDGRLPPPPMAATLGMALARVGEGVAVFTCEPVEAHENPLGTVHGGLAAALLDSATGCAVHTTLPAGTGYTTVTLSVDLLRPLTARTGRVRCEGRVVHRGGRVAVAEGEVVGEGDGRVYARGRTVCLVIEP
jgi:uncharacterized protein (TIGR00369 family)